MFASARTVSLQGAVGHVVDVQVDISQGTPSTALVGRPDASINEARERCRSALDNSGFHWPTTRRTTILLSPADLPKRGPHFDLAIAIGVLAADVGKPDAASLRDLVLIGELSLDGRVRCVPGVLPMVMAAAARGITRVVVPEPQVGEAALVEGVEVYGVRSLRQVVSLLAGEEIPDAPPVEPPTGEPLLPRRAEERDEAIDLADVLGMADARFALEVAAVGAHHLLLSGAKGAGKTTLAERLPTILPDLDVQESLELTAIHSLCGGLPPGSGVLTRPPFRAPHHTASRSGILGGGTGRVRPGEVSKATHGVLFLDEFPLLPADIVEALRQPLESGEISIARGDEDATYPASGMLVLACNPCPCGEYSARSRDHQCICSEVRRREYRRKISGPIADRIDITRIVEPVGRHELADRFAAPETSAVVLARVAAARDRQRERYAGTGWRLNAHAPGPALSADWPLTPVASQRLDREVYGGRLTRRGATKVHRVAWSVADLRGVDRPGTDELEVALRLRRGSVLEHAMITPASLRSA
ncbi:ATP-binding protein [Nocardioides marmoriginsengisoli]|uniref:ATP-binding protein n=1 Tax=Nocardioides marmoriginsengisoli TaxID=661483 RepID=A0A3N0CNW4_9ACTN|nr:YifB family Mg chelatase-like AAA ATPase [Nocardioides marmoriginsengisoli]RNL65125.1 ATP-binding protein [Nocardioides marmoriginsengisoli]